MVRVMIVFKVFGRQIKVKSMFNLYPFFSFQFTFSERKYTTRIEYCNVSLRPNKIVIKKKTTTWKSTLSARFPSGVHILRADCRPK